MPILRAASRALPPPPTAPALSSAVGIGPVAQPFHLLRRKGLVVRLPEEHTTLGVVSYFCPNTGKARTKSSKSIRVLDQTLPKGPQADGTRWHMKILPPA